jgi:SNF2 family DNA or RNA helicase
MIIEFSKDKQNIFFKPQTQKEITLLDKFPGLVKFRTDFSIENSCPAVFPIVYNLIQRLKEFGIPTSSILIDSALDSWLNQLFKLLPLPAAPEFYYHTSPKDFQEIALRYLYTLGSAGILLDPGMGKTKVVLDYIFLKKFRRSLVVCPAALLFVWEDEIKRHRPELSYHVVTSTDWLVELPKILTSDVTIINYNKSVILKHRIMETPIDFIHLDEFLIKDPSTDRTKSLLEISKKIPYRCGGSGTLINNSPLDSFSPIRFLQPSLVGRNYSTFMERYCVMRDVVRPGSLSKSKVPVAFRKQDEVRSILDSCCIVMTKEKWLKLPQKHFHDILVQMTPAQKEIYYSLSRNYYVNVQGRDIKADNPLVMLAKLYQISQGFVYYSEDEQETLSELLSENTGPKPNSKSLKRSIVPRETIFIDRNNNPKIAALRKLLTTEVRNRKVIIWFNLSAEFELIKELLLDLDIPFLSIQGGDKKIGEKVRTFNKTPSIKVLACQAKSVNYGITVLGSKKVDLEKETQLVFPDIDTEVYTEIFFSLSFSLEVYSQQQDRIHRLGQEKDCHYYRLFCNNPVETKIRQIIAEKLSMRMEMLIDVANTILTDITELEELNPI